jgi:hypothetical protein
MNIKKKEQICQYNDKVNKSWVTCHHSTYSFPPFELLLVHDPSKKIRKLIYLCCFRIFTSFLLSTLLPSHPLYLFVLSSSISPILPPLLHVKTVPSPPPSISISLSYLISFPPLPCILLPSLLSVHPMFILYYIQATLHFACILAQQHWVFSEQELAIIYM